MSIAAVARIVEAPDPPDSGTELRIERESGPRFPIPPLDSFIALLWQTDRVPVLGQNAEEVTVTNITPDLAGDIVEMIRADTDRISVYPGMNFSLLREQPVYSLGESFKVRGPVESETGGTVTVQDPQGGTVTYSGGDLAQDGHGWYLPFMSQMPGQFYATWESNQEWFVRFGATS